MWVCLVCLDDDEGKTQLDHGSVARHFSCIFARDLRRAHLYLGLVRRNGMYTIAALRKAPLINHFSTKWAHLRPAFAHPVRYTNAAGADAQLSDSKDHTGIISISETK